MSVPGLGWVHNFCWLMAENEGSSPPTATASGGPAATGGVDNFLGSSPKQCECCGRGFRTVRGLRQHQRMAHGPASSPVATGAVLESLCLVCGRSFRSARGRLVHMRWAHPECSMEDSPPREAAEIVMNTSSPGEEASVPEAPVRPPFHCSVEGCGRCFTTRNGVGQHMRRAHVAEANDNIETARTKPRWSEEERDRVAWKEAELVMAGTRFMNQALVTFFPQRGLDAIKSHRRSEDHRRRVDVALQRLRGAAVPMGAPNTTPPAASSRDSLLEALRNSTEKLAATASLKPFADIVSAAANGEGILPRVELFLREYYRSPGRPQPSGVPPPPSDSLSRRKRRRAEYARIQALYRRSRKNCAREILDGRPTWSITQPVAFLDYWERLMAPGEANFHEDGMDSQQPRAFLDLMGPVGEREKSEGVYPPQKRRPGLMT